MKEIGKSKQPLLRDAYNRFQEFKKDFHYKDFNKYSDKMVKEIHRDLNYIDNLKSSTLEGATKGAETFGRTKETLSSLSQEKQKEFWDTFNKAYKDLAPAIIERFKYDVFDVITNEMLMGETQDDIFEKLQEALDLANKYGENEVEKGELFAENLELLFSDSMEDLFDEYF